MHGIIAVPCRIAEQGPPLQRTVEIGRPFCDRSDNRLYSLAASQVCIPHASGATLRYRWIYSLRAHRAAPASLPSPCDAKPLIRIPASPGSCHSGACARGSSSSQRPSTVLAWRGGGQSHQPAKACLASQDHSAHGRRAGHRRDYARDRPWQVGGVTLARAVHAGGHGRVAARKTRTLSPSCARS
jgi:hypothetical protein